MEPIGQVIKRLRLAKGMSQAKLAELSGLESSYISRLEAGKRPKSITLYTARALAKGLGVSPEELMKTDEKDLLQAAPLIPGLEAPESRSLKDLLRTLGERFEAEPLNRVPVRGSVPAGCPLPQEEEAGEFIDVPNAFMAGAKRAYALRISGESLGDMGIHDGDMVLVDPDAAFVEGKTFVLRIGAECCVKRVHLQDGRLLLVGANGTLEIRELQEVQNLGRVVMSMRLQ